MSITIKDGVGFINGEAMTTDVDYNDGGEPGPISMRTRRMRIDCGNGYKLSVVFGSFTYSDNHDHGFAGNQWCEEVCQAEIAVLGPLELSEPFKDEWGDGVKGYCSGEEILAVLERTRALPLITPATQEEHAAYWAAKRAELQTNLAALKPEAV